MGIESPSATSSSSPWRNSTAATSDATTTTAASATVSNTGLGGLREAGSAPSGRSAPSGSDDSLRTRRA
ncbi:hypothetical protein GCM10009675_50780 [Prauserella alba]|uniref:Uncharacterized protein n=1 Tax=Prauserella alba TaxID=176898 RepID=A0ABN1VSN5_9PSEU